MTTKKNRITALLVDDEPLARQGMHDLLAAYPEIDIIGEADSLSHAREKIAEAPPELIFLDIQLYGESGFDLLVDLPKETAVIFVTAYDRYAVRAFEVNALDYLLKPITPERLEQTINRHTENSIPKNLKNNDCVYLQQGCKRWFEPVENFVVLIADGDHSKLWLTDGNCVVVRRSLNVWSKQLPSSSFLRIHRNAIVNLAQVRHIQKMNDGRQVVSLKNVSFEPEISRRRFPDLQTQLEKLRQAR